MVSLWSSTTASQLIVGTSVSSSGISGRVEIPSISVLKITRKLVSETVSNSSFSSRFNNGTKLQKKWRSFASDSNPLGESMKEKSDRVTSQSQGPPFFTILAGFAVLFIMCWALGSMGMWLFGLIVKVFPPKG